MSPSYKPKPIDTSEVALPGRIKDLMEILARHNHDVYAMQRMREGWRYGPARDDEKKTNPTLVAYDELPESEKDLDRNTVRGILQAILKLGYAIEPLGMERGQESAQSHGLQPESCLNAAKKLRDAGRPLQAYDLLSEALRQHPSVPSLVVQQALALGDCHAPERAVALLQSLRQLGHRDTESEGIWARLHKDIWVETRGTVVARRALETAYQAYFQAYRRSNWSSYWTGINAATLSLHRNCPVGAKRLARCVLNTCLEEKARQRRRSDDPYWLLATIGEAYLVLGRLEDAHACYIEATQSAEGRHGRLASTRRNAALVLEALALPVSEAEAWLQATLPMPIVVVFSGHMLDAPDRRDARFPAALAPHVRRALSQELQGMPIGHGYASAACGSDILFHEVLAEMGVGRTVVLPCASSRFERESVYTQGGSRWRKRFRQVLSTAERVLSTSDSRISTEPRAYEYANQVLHGLATLHAQRWSSRVEAMAVSDGASPGLTGGTASLIKWWRMRGQSVTVIDSDALLRERLPDLWSPRKNEQSQCTQKAVSPKRKPGSTAVRTMLFADVEGYSLLEEDAIPHFVKHFMGGVARLVAGTKSPPVVKNTWGDALYFVFESPRDAGNVALALCEFVQNTRWETLGLPAQLSIRVSLHAGPVYETVDPVTREPTYTGTHVSRAARIEPITPACHVYASEAYAALLACEQVHDLACDYVGETPLAKRYGTFPVYHIRRQQRR